MTAADKYYLKAKDNYAYDLDTALEALEYGLACDDEHPGLLTLMGHIYYHDLNRYDAARECLELALLSDPGFTDIYYTYLKFALHIGEWNKAEKLVRQALLLPGIDKARVYHYMALLHEKQGQYDAAINSLADARTYCTSKKCYEYYEEETERMELKHAHVKDMAKPIRIVLK